jgi:hypothetical protein
VGDKVGGLALNPKSCFDLRSAARPSNFSSSIFTWLLETPLLSILSKTDAKSHLYWGLLTLLRLVSFSGTEFELEVRSAHKLWLNGGIWNKELNDKSSHRDSRIYLWHLLPGPVPATHFTFARAQLAHALDAGTVRGKSKAIWPAIWWPVSIL